MFPGQPAALSKKLALGDIVLEVNGKSLENASHQDAINMIRHEPSVVRLLVKRDPSTIPEVLLSRAASNASDVDPVQLLNDIQNKLRSQTTSPVSSSSQETQSSNIEKLAAHLETAEEIRNLREKREESAAYENDRTLQHQLSDPSALITKAKDHEPVTTSHSLPGKLSLKSRYFDNKPDDKDSGDEYKDKTETNANESPYLGRKSSDSAVKESQERRLHRTGSDQISSESDLPSMLEHLRSQDSLKRIMSPQAPLAEYEESDLDIDEGIMINVDDGVAVRIDDDDDDDERASDSDDHHDDDDTITKPSESYNTASSERNGTSDANNDDDSSHDTADDSDDNDDDDDSRNKETASLTPKVTSDTSDVDDEYDDDDNEDIDAVLELLTNGLTPQKREELSLDPQKYQDSDDEDSEIHLNVNEDLNLEDHDLKLKDSREPRREDTNDRSLDNQPGPTWSEESLSEKLESLEETIVESTPDLSTIPAGDEASLTPKEQVCESAETRCNIRRIILQAMLMSSTVARLCAAKCIV